MACNFVDRCEEFHPALRIAYLKNWLVNPTGKEWGWIEVDLCQEHFNKILKGANPTNQEFDAPHIRHNLSLNLSFLGTLRAGLLQALGLTARSGSHTKKDITPDINFLAQAYVHDRILLLRKRREHPHRPTDKISDGLTKLQSRGQLAKFLARTVANPTAVNDIDM